MRTTINHALDILEEDSEKSSPELAQEPNRIVKRVQSDYLEIVENALSLLIQRKEDECKIYLTDERNKLEETKDRIGGLISQEGRWTRDFHRLTIEYLFTRARLVDEIRMFPDFALELLDRLTLDQSLHETITYLENAMTGKQDLFTALIHSNPSDVP